MTWKEVRTIFISFLAGMLFMGGLWVNQEGQSTIGEKSFASSDEQVPTAQTVSATTVDPITSTNVIAEMVQKAGPAVVLISTESQASGALTERDQIFRQFFGDQYPIPEQKQSGLGSGFIIRDDGYILTNNHVIEDADTIKVSILGYDEPFVAKVIGRDPELDLAVLKVNADKKLPFLKLGDSDNIQVGEWSIAIGNPFGLDHTVTVGVISAKGRPLTIGNQYFKNLLQTDASINPGNSGGPLLNLNGEVIGINTAINAQGQGLGFAIPINTVQDVLTDLIENGKVSRPWLGVGIQDLNQQLVDYFQLESAEGVVVVQVVENGPAYKAGIQQGDVILEMNGQKVKNTQELKEIVDQSKIGDNMEVLLWSQGKLKPITVKIDEKMYN